MPDVDPNSYDSGWFASQRGRPLSSFPDGSSARNGARDQEWAAYRERVFGKPKTLLDLIPSSASQSSASTFSSSSTASTPSAWQAPSHTYSSSGSSYGGSYSSKGIVYSGGDSSGSAWGWIIGIAFLIGIAALVGSNQPPAKNAMLQGYQIMPAQGAHQRETSTPSAASPTSPQTPSPQPQQEAETASPPPITAPSSEGQQETAPPEQQAVPPSVPDEQAQAQPPIIQTTTDEFGCNDPGAPTLIGNAVLSSAQLAQAQLYAQAYSDASKSYRDCLTPHAERDLSDYKRGEAMKNYQTSYGAAETVKKDFDNARDRAQSQSIAGN